ncbi:MAG: hypothetical protein C4339_05535 [Nitrososphaerota archaeon]
MAKAVVLAGGEGTRLRPLTYYFQKAMLPIGPRQRPLLEYILQLLRLHGLQEVVLLVGYRAEQVMNYFGGGEGLGLRIRYILDEPQLRGTAGALLNALHKGAISERETLLVYYGDILSDIDLTQLLRFHMGCGGAATLAVSRRYPLPVGVVKVRGRRVLELREKPSLGLRVTMGILALEGRAIRLIEGRLRERGGADIMADLIPQLLRSGEKVSAYETEAFWYDVGSVERYERLNSEVDFAALEGLLMGLADRRAGA